MIAAIVSVYLVISLVFFFLILSMAVMATLFGSFPGSDIIKIFLYSFIWPVMIVWGLGNWIIHKIRVKRGKH